MSLKDWFVETRTVNIYTYKGRELTADETLAELSADLVAAGIMHWADEEDEVMAGSGEGMKPHEAFGDYGSASLSEGLEPLVSYDDAQNQRGGFFRRWLR